MHSFNTYQDPYNSEVVLHGFRDDPFATSDTTPILHELWVIKNKSGLLHSKFGILKASFRRKWRLQLIEEAGAFNERKKNR